MSNTDGKIIIVDVTINLKGRDVRLNERYFEIMGESSVFTQGRSYRVLDSDQGTATLKDDKRITRCINISYLDW